MSSLDRALETATQHLVKAKAISRNRRNIVISRGCIPEKVERYVEMFYMQWHPDRTGIIFGVVKEQSWWQRFSPQRWFGALL